APRSRPSFRFCNRSESRCTTFGAAASPPLAPSRSSATSPRAKEARRRCRRRLATAPSVELRAPFLPSWRHLHASLRRDEHLALDDPLDVVTKLETVGLELGAQGRNVARVAAGHHSAPERVGEKL